MAGIKKWKTLNEEVVFDHHWYTVRKDIVELPSGQIVDDYFVSVRPDVVLVLPVTSTGEIILVRQYKHAAGEVVEELPGGVFNSSGETPEQAARRELLEETGYEVKGELKLMTTIFTNPTKDTSKAYLFIAREVQKAGKQQLDDTEDIEVFTITPHEFRERAVHGSFPAGDSLSAALLGLHELGL